MITLDVTTHKREDMIDITDLVRQAIRNAGIGRGMAYLHVPHTTSAITINENADPDVVHDLLLGLQRLAPRDAGYRHAEGNSDAHIKSSLLGVDQTLLIEDGKPVLGTWQGIYFCEFDGPRRRKLHIRILAA
ncbi:MAG: secondary thiamine-phosphate synthase enzyme YjbQ [Pedobacter sp.]